MSRMMWVEIGEDACAVRIFKNQKQAAQSPHWPARIMFMLRAEAVTQIRLKIFNRDNRACTHCGDMVSWHDMEMHERIWRGRGGEISVANGTTLCNNCHQNDEVAGHGKRKIQWSV